VLAISGHRPAPGHGTVEEEEQEGTAENELAVSFCSIQNSRLGSQRGSISGMSNPGSDGVSPTADTPVGGSSSGTGEGGQEEQVEAKLGHRFDLVEPETLGLMLKDFNVREQLLVVDVRGRDWNGGHIPSSINLRTSEVVQHPEALLAQCRQNRIHDVIITCMYSVLRARKCAAALERAQLDEQRAGHAPYRVRIHLLRGGMHAWVNHYVGPSVDATREAVVERDFLVDFDPEMWSDGGPSQGGLVHVMDALWSSGGQKALSDALTEELSALQALQKAEELGDAQEQPEA